MQANLLNLELILKSLAFFHRLYLQSQFSGFFIMMRSIFSCIFW
jgi:hypothetical protein